MISPLPQSAISSKPASGFLWCPHPAQSDSVHAACRGTLVGLRCPTCHDEPDRLHSVAPAPGTCCDSPRTLPPKCPCDLLLVVGCRGVDLRRGELAWRTAVRGEQTSFGTAWSQPGLEEFHPSLRTRRAERGDASVPSSALPVRGNSHATSQRRLEQRHSMARHQWTSARRERAPAVRLLL